MKKMKKIMVTVSGGRSSAYKAIMLKKHYSHKYEMVFSFANTGQEHPETLNFINKLDKRFNLNLIWIEAVIHHGERVASTHKVVSYETCTKIGERGESKSDPFEEVIKKYGLPNQNFPHCTRELKINPANSLMKELGIEVKTLGIRIDEPKRIRREEGVLYPLVDLFPATKSDVLLFWRQQDFDLEITEELGNCVGCYKKSNSKLWTIAKDNNKFFDFFREMEEKYSEVGTSVENGGARKIYRGHCSSLDIIEASKKDFREFAENTTLTPSIFAFTDIDECADECGSVQ